MALPPALNETAVLLRDRELMSVERNLSEMEMSREAYWLRYPGTSPFKLRRRALTVRHCLHVLPGERILELGAGSGLWTEHLSRVLRGQNPITAAVFNEEFLAPPPRRLPDVEFVHVTDLTRDLPEAAFDYVVGTVILCHDLYPQTLAALHRLLKPGGQLLFFEANFWNPQVLLKNVIRPVGRWSGDARCHVGMRKYELMKRASHQGFTNIDIIPYDIIHARTPRWLLSSLQFVSFILEQTPVVRSLCGTLYIWLTKPGDERARRPHVNLAEHLQLFDSTSVVVPCHNEEMNIGPLVDALVEMYGDYLHQIVIVNDNSTDRTADVALALAGRDPRITLVNRTPPGGVGRALRDGYAAATGRYIFTMDCDFVQIVPEFRDMFDVVAAGHDGAIGSRFSLDSVLINYPFLKVLSNRACHLVINLLLPRRVRDVSNNLKLCRTAILKDLEIEQDHFAANMETGLKPLLSGFDIREVPMSWINRTADMGKSNFDLLRVGPDYFLALMRVVVQVLRGRRSFIRTTETRNSRRGNEQPQTRREAPESRSGPRNRHRDTEQPQTRREAPESPSGPRNRHRDTELPQTHREAPESPSGTAPAVHRK
jgi:SAM-dependent methyltransferase